MLLNSDPAERLWDSHPRAGPCVPQGWDREMLPRLVRVRALREPRGVEGFGCGMAEAWPPPEPCGLCEEMVKWVLLIHAGSSAPAASGAWG